MKHADVFKVLSKSHYFILASVSKKLYQQGVTNFTLAPGHAPFKVAIFVKGTKVIFSYLL